MNKIQFDPKEGTTGFWGLCAVPNRPEVTLVCTEDCQGECGDICPIISGNKERLRQYGLALALCKSNRLEIVNDPQWLYKDEQGFYRLFVSDRRPDRKEYVKPGDIFDLPEGWGFEEMYQYHSSKKHYTDADWVDCNKSQYESLLTIDCTTRTVLRLVPLTVKEDVNEKVFTLEEVKKIVFSFCEWTDRGMGEMQAFSHPPALNDRWIRFIAITKPTFAQPEAVKEENKPTTMQDVLDAAHKEFTNEVKRDELLKGQRRSFVSGYVCGTFFKAIVKAVKEEASEIQYFKLSRNESGAPFLFYKPEGGGRFRCWMPIDEEFYNEFEKLIQRKKI